MSLRSFALGLARALRYGRTKKHGTCQRMRLSGGKPRFRSHLHSAGKRGRGKPSDPRRLPWKAHSAGAHVRRSAACQSGWRLSAAAGRSVKDPTIRRFLHCRLIQGERAFGVRRARWCIDPRGSPERSDPPLLASHANGSNRIARRTGRIPCRWRGGGVGGARCSGLEKAKRRGAGRGDHGGRRASRPRAGRCPAS